MRIIFPYYFKSLVVKPDQLIKRRGKLGLLKVNVNWDGAKDWLGERRGKEIEVKIVFSR